MRSRITRGALAVAGVLSLGFASAVPGSAAVSHARISGTGSSWSANAVNQWVADEAHAGLQVVFTSNGSAQGRKDFAYKNNDFAVSDIGFQGVDKQSGAADTSGGRDFAYLPIVAGGTAFPYQIKVGGKRVTNLRLSGQTLAKIFTNQITNWSDPAITADNNGKALPSKPIIPVVHSEGAGSTAQFTQYLAKQFPGLWTSFNGGDSGFTEYFPRAGAQVAASGSDGVINTITAGSGDGTIGYDEYSYAKAVNYPVAKILNSAGYYTLPTQFNDAVALTKAVIDTNPNSPTYLLQTLDAVYTNPAPATYPLSSYSYGIIPTSPTDSTMTTAKRQTLADFLFYSVCGGQSEVGNIGYSALPYNLVNASFQQIGKLKAADAGVDLSSQSPASCSNPTFNPANLNENRLATLAPTPATCDKQGQGPCTDDTSTGAANAGKASTGTGAQATPKAATATKKATGTTGTAAAANGATTGTAANGGAAAAADAGGAAVDPETGVAVDASGTDGSSSSGNDVTANPTVLASAERSGSNLNYAILAAVFLLLILIGPPVLFRRLATNRKSS